MPKEDVVWQGTRRAIEVLHQYADACGVVKKRGFAQSLYLSIEGRDQGICYGLAIGYILEVAKFGVADEFLDTVFISAAKRITDRKDPALNVFYQKVAGDYGNLQYSGQHIPFLEANAFLSRVKEKKFDQITGRLKKLSEFLTAAEGYYLICTPNHAMASTKKGQYCTFFEPNTGEFTFGTPKDFQKFIQKYLGHPSIQKSYAGHKGTKINPGAQHKTIHFIVDHFA